MFNSLLGGIDNESCRDYGGAVRIIACIETPVVIEQLLDHLKARTEANESTPLPESRLACRWTFPTNTQTEVSTPTPIDCALPAR